MGLLDILLIFSGFTAGVFSFLSGGDSLHKLFFGLIIGFLIYALVATQIELVNYISHDDLNSYQIFLNQYATGTLSVLLTFVPILGIFFMFSSKISIDISQKSPSHLLLGLLLPIYLVGILSFLGNGSILAENPTWIRVFSFFESSSIYQIFQTLPWAIFAFLASIAFYKVFFTIAINFCIWIYRDIIQEFFRSWKQKREQDELEREDDE